MNAAFLDAIFPAAETCEQQTGIPKWITCAQAVLESGWGQSQLATQACNLFGIKANQSQIADGEYQEFPTHEYESGRLELVEADFAKYATITTCFLAHGQLIANSPRYAPAMAVKNNLDSFAWALGPKTAAHPEGCGYSTNPGYHDLLMQLVREVQAYEGGA